MELSDKEIAYLLQLVMTDLQRMDAQSDHALAHGQEIYLPNHQTAADIKGYLLREFGSGDLSDMAS